VVKRGIRSGDPAHDVLGYEGGQLDAIFRPETVAVIGATDRPGSVGRTIMWNLVSNPFGGTVFPVNSKRPNVLGIKAYPSVSEVPQKVDLAVIVAPAPTVPGIIAECAEAGVVGAIVISAGFRETGPEGIELEERVLAEARRGRMRIIGPNCLGVMNPITGLNATFRGCHGQARQRRAPEPERGPAHRHIGQELQGEHRLLEHRLRRHHDGRGLGRPDLPPRRRPEDEEHRRLHGVRRRRPLVPLGRPARSPSPSP
jgi:predicted CoA-binding protein